MQIFDLSQLVCRLHVLNSIRVLYLYFTLYLVKYFIVWLCTCINPFIKYKMEFGSEIFVSESCPACVEQICVTRTFFNNYSNSLNFHWFQVNQCKIKILLSDKFIVASSGYRSEFEQHVVPSHLRSFLWALVPNLGIWTSDSHDHDSWEAHNPAVPQCCPHLQMEHGLAQTSS